MSPTSYYTGELQRSDTVQLECWTNVECGNWMLIEPQSDHHVLKSNVHTSSRLHRDTWENALSRKPLPIQEIVSLSSQLVIDQDRQGVTEVVSIRLKGVCGDSRGSSIVGVILLAAQLLVPWVQWKCRWPWFEGHPEMRTLESSRYCPSWVDLVYSWTSSTMQCQNGLIVVDALIGFLVIEVIGPEWYSSSKVAEPKSISRMSVASWTSGMTVSFSTLLLPRPSGSWTQGKDIPTFPGTGMWTTR